MDRKTFLHYLAISPFLASALPLSALELFLRGEHTPRMPLLFVGHGSPMNAVEKNAFSKGWSRMGRDLPKPKAILCISAHWETQGTRVTAMAHPKTIHDFRGFPAELYQVQYPAPGDPALAGVTQQLLSAESEALDLSWGLDHGCWSVVRKMYPEANIPVLQLSLDRRLSPQQHMELAARLAPLRSKGILIMGSGNMVHHLGKIDWHNPGRGYDWAIEANEGFKTLIQNQDHRTLAGYKGLSQAFQWAVPTPEHYLPLLYILGLRQKQEPLHFFNDQLVMGSISMTSLRIG